MGASILIADDDSVSRKLLIRLLEQDGHDVRAAENGTQALELFAEEPSDVVLLDIVMPGLDGVSVLRRLKEIPYAHHIPVIMISVWGTRSPVWWRGGRSLGRRDRQRRPLYRDRRGRLPCEAVQSGDPASQDQRGPHEEAAS